MYLTKTINGVQICYDECGTVDKPALVLLTGWAHDLRLYDELLPYLSRNYWVIRVCWRGHGPSRDNIPDFGVEEQVSDTIGLLNALEVDTFYLVSHSHGGWSALGIVDKLGKERVLCLLMLDLIMTPPPPQFAAGLQMMQDKKMWKAARQGLYDNWSAGSKNQIAVRVGDLAYELGTVTAGVLYLPLRMIEIRWLGRL
ncbi:alpha/beta-hydrolase [Aspergillus ellipticus CBS 707.79]|uniref:Alpha/beta-hydrolase n=1 Tax=Aspergillus ellipticus CBS 707.79 TaxID=1448320 RepID=A0A319DP63_9EURO|nr:alpha/beta-hydrolase [Aspergillus ellipticus CBS 707.79]